jgi:hypothetical protein
MGISPYLYAIRQLLWLTMVVRLMDPERNQPKLLQLVLHRVALFVTLVSTARQVRRRALLAATTMPMMTF